MHNSSASNTNQVQAMFELGMWWWLRLHISWIVCSTNLQDLNINIFNNVSNKMIPDINMLRPLMRHVIFSQVYNTLTITLDNSNFMIHADLSKQASQPNSFLNSHIFCFCSRESNCMLQSSSPTNFITSKGKYIISQRSPPIKITNIV